MSSADNMSLPDRVRAYARRAALAGASLGLVVSGTVAAAEPPVTVEYQSIFAGYRHFDAQAPAVEWRQANDAIRDGAEGAAHGMHDMRAPTEAAPDGTDESQPTTPGDHQEHPPMRPLACGRARRVAFRTGGAAFLARGLCVDGHSGQPGRDECVRLARGGPGGATPVNS